MKKNPISPPELPASTTSIELRLVLKIPEFGKRYDVSKRTVFKWLAKGLPHLKLSERNTRIPTNEGDRWVQQNCYRQRAR